jgi:hypothetical protein
MNPTIKAAIPLHTTCRQAAHLMLQEQDKPLALRDRLALRVHLWMCQACPRFQRQLQTMSRALSDWRNESTK